MSGWLQKDFVSTEKNIFLRFCPTWVEKECVGKKDSQVWGKIVQIVENSKSLPKYKQPAAGNSNSMKSYQQLLENLFKTNLFPYIVLFLGKILCRFQRDKLMAIYLEDTLEETVR